MSNLPPPPPPPPPGAGRGSRRGSKPDRSTPKNKPDSDGFGKNDSGDAVATGVYGYKLSTGSRVLTKKMVLLK